MYLLLWHNLWVTCVTYMTYLSHVFAFVAFLCKTSPFCPSVHVSVQCRILYLQQSTGEGLSVESREGPRHGTTSSREGKSRERENHRMRLVNRPAREREREKKNIVVLRSHEKFCHSSLMSLMVHPKGPSERFQSARSLLRVYLVPLRVVLRCLVARFSVVWRGES